MPADANSIDDEINKTTARVRKAAKAAVDSATDAGHERLTEVVDNAEKVIRDATRRIEKAVRDGIETIRDQSGPYTKQASAQFDEASKYVVERVKERPMTATLAGIGVGLLLGLLLAYRPSDK
jgi:ElaB/YqjD/DUF883 family membrane-anchored ribosome-binding protein